eukprot:scaffold3791_cov390-Prasinococcus_capsulatus_cf.AAC.5
MELWTFALSATNSAPSSASLVCKNAALLGSRAMPGEPLYTTRGLLSRRSSAVRVAAPCSVPGPARRHAALVGGEMPEPLGSCCCVKRRTIVNRETALSRNLVYRLSPEVFQTFIVDPPVASLAAHGPWKDMASAFDDLPTYHRIRLGALVK